MSRVTVIIPTYNRVHLISETLDSVLAQTFCEFEVIVVDDGSTDGTASLIQDRYSGIKYHWQPNSGTAAGPRNTGAELTTSEFIAFVDSDDLWFPDKLARQFGAFESNNDSSLIFSDANHVDSNGRTLCEMPTFVTNASSQSGVSLGGLFQRNFVPCPTPLLRREVFDRAGGFDPSMDPAADWDLWLRVATLGRLTLVSDVLASVRLGNNRMSDNRIAMLSADVRVLEKFRQLHPSRFQAFGGQGRRRFSDAYLALGIALHDREQERTAAGAVLKSIMVDPSNRRAWTRLALLALRGKHVVAISRLRSGSDMRNVVRKR